MSEFEYYLSKQAHIYPDVAIMNKVREMKLNHGMQFHMDSYYMPEDAIEYGIRIKQQMASELGHKMLEEDKIKFTSFSNPAVNGRTLRGETIVMTEQELYTLLSHFGIQVKVTKERERL
jgi:hypothetical protein